MITDADKLLNTCLEIEGLLCLIARRGDTIPENIGFLLKSKAEYLYSNMNSMLEEKTTEKTDCELPPLDAVLPEDTEQDKEIAESVELEEAEDAEPFSETVQVPEEAESNDTEIDLMEDTVVMEEPVETVDTELPQTEPAKTVSDTAAAQTVRNDTVAVELTINDKFRFRRELFANSDVDLAEALQVASQMSSAEELEDYFFNDLCFDPENEVVKDFMRIMTSRF